MGFMQTGQKEKEEPGSLSNVASPELLTQDPHGLCGFGRQRHVRFAREAHLLPLWDPTVIWGSSFTARPIQSL